MNQERNFSQWFKEATENEPYPYQTRGRKGELRDSEKELRDGR